MSFLGRVYSRHKFKQNIIFSKEKKNKKNIFITTELCKASKVVSIALFLPLSFEQTESFKPRLKVAVNQWKSVVKYQEKLLNPEHVFLFTQIIYSSECSNFFI